jgi:hypothetical protein
VDTNGPLNMPGYVLLYIKFGCIKCGKIDCPKSNMCVEELSDAITVAARFCNSGMLGLNPTRGVDVCPPYGT